MTGRIQQWEKRESVRKTESKGEEWSGGKGVGRVD